MPNYTKLFNSIITSTIWTEDDKTRIVWITMLAIADQNGEIQGSIPGLARLAGVSVKDTETALEKFLSPDAYSRTPDYDGRRICKIEGGWELLNHAKYRRMASLADQKEANAKRQKRHRERNASVTDSNVTVTHSNAGVTLKTDKAEAEAEAEAEEVIPLTPKGEVVKKKRVKRSKNQTVDYNTIEMQRIGSWFGRKETTLWTVDEYEAYESIQEDCRGEAQINGMEYFYLAEEKENDPLYRRTTLKTLLNNWMGELEKARAYSKKNQ